MEAQDLIKKVSKLLPLPKDRHPIEVPDDALAIGKMAGVIKVWAQNGSIYDVKLADGTMQKIHKQDLCVRIFKMIDAKQEKEAKLSVAAEVVAPVMEVVVDDGAMKDEVVDAKEKEIQEVVEDEDNVSEEKPAPEAKEAEEAEEAEETEEG